jgi:hypothetical protein
MAKVFKEKNSRKVWVLHLQWSHKASATVAYSIKDTRKEVRALKKSFGWAIADGIVKADIHKGLQNTETGALLVDGKILY